MSQAVAGNILPKPCIRWEASPCHVFMWLPVCCRGRWQHWTSLSSQNYWTALFQSGCGHFARRMKATSGRPWETFTSSQTSSWCGRRLALHVAITALLVPAVILVAVEVEHSRRNHC